MLKKQPIQQIIANFPREGKVSVYSPEQIFKLYFDYINPEGGLKEDEDSSELHKQNYITLLRRSSHYLQINQVTTQALKNFFPTKNVSASDQLDFYKKLYTMIIDERKQGQQKGVFSDHFVDGLREIYKENIGEWYTDERFENTKVVIQRALGVLHTSQTTAITAFTGALKGLEMKYTNRGKPKWPLSFLNIEEKALKQLNALQAIVNQYTLGDTVRPELFANLLLTISDMAAPNFEKGVANILKPCINNFLTSADKILGFSYLKARLNPLQGDTESEGSFLKLLNTHFFKAQHDDNVKSIALRIALLDDSFFSLMMLFPRLHDPFFSVDLGEKVRQTYIEVMKDYHLEVFRRISDPVLNDNIKPYLQSTPVQPKTNVQPRPPSPTFFSSSAPPSKAPVRDKELVDVSSQFKQKEKTQQEVKELKGKEKIFGYQLTDDDLNIAIDRFYLDNKSIKNGPLGLLPVRVSVLKANDNIPQDREVNFVIAQLPSEKNKAYCGIVHYINHYFFIMVRFDGKGEKRIIIIDPENECDAKVSRRNKIKQVLGQDVEFIPVSQQPEGDGSACGIFCLQNVAAFFNGLLNLKNGTVDKNKLTGKEETQRIRAYWEDLLARQSGKDVTFHETPKIIKTIQNYDFIKERDKYFKNLERDEKKSAILSLQETFSDWLKAKDEKGDAQISLDNKEQLMASFNKENEIKLASLTGEEMKGYLDEVFDNFIKGTETLRLQ